MKERKDNSESERKKWEEIIQKLRREKSEAVTKTKTMWQKVTFNTYVSKPMYALCRLRWIRCKI